MQPELTIMHLTSSRFYGGPERQMLGLAEALRPRVNTVFASFSENELNQSFLDHVSKAGFTGVDLRYDTPRLMAARREIVGLIKQYKVDVLVCHGYKAGMVGWFAARNAGIPVIAVSRGWTGENLKVRCYESLDRMMLRRMDRVVCVSQAQAEKVRAAGVKPGRIVVIHNSIDANRFATVDPGYREKLTGFFPPSQRAKIKNVVGAAGRLSPEKGFDLLVEAASKVLSERSDTVFVLFGDGPLRETLQSQVDRLGIADQFVLAGFTDQLDQWMPHLNLFVQSSHSEGMPNVILESLAAGVPVVATDVGGTREIIDASVNGRLVPSDSVNELHTAIIQAIANPLEYVQRKALQSHVGNHFDFSVQANRYLELANDLLGRSSEPLNAPMTIHDIPEKANVVG